MYFGLCTYDIIKENKSLDPSKAHGHDEISTETKKQCASSIKKILSVSCRTCFENKLYLMRKRKPIFH